MPTNTTNFGLIKPGQEEFYNVDVPNANMDTIDRVLKALQDAISSGASEQDLKILIDALATHLTEEASLTEAGHVMLSNLISGTSEDKAATELAVKNAIAHVKAWGRSKITEGSLQTDPNTTDHSLILVQGHPNAPTGGIWYISTFFYYADPSNAKSQIAISYNKDYGRGMYWRDCFGGVWQPWVKILDETMKNVPGGVVGIGTDGFATVPSKESKIVAGDEYSYVLPKTTGGTLEGVMTPMIAFNMFMTGTIRVTFQLFNQSAAAHYSRGSEGQLYVNDVPVGILRFVESTKGASFTEDIPIKFGDTLKIMGRSLINPGYNTQTLIQQVTIKRRGDITL